MTVRCSIRLIVQAIEVDGKVLNLIGCALQVVDLIPRVAADGHTLMVNTPSLLPPPHPFSPVQVGGFGHPNKHRMAKLFFHSFGGKPSCFPSRRGGCYGLSAPTHADIFFMDPIEVGRTTFLHARTTHKSDAYSGGKLPTKENVPMNMMLPTQQHCVDDDLDGIKSCIAVPANPKDYLSRVYGKNWRTPIQFKVHVHSELNRARGLGVALYSELNKFNSIELQVMVT